MLLEKGRHSGEEALEDGRLKEVIVEVVEDPASGESHRGEEVVQVGHLGGAGHRRKEGDQAEDLKAKEVWRHHHFLWKCAAAAEKWNSWKSGSCGSCKPPKRVEAGAAVVKEVVVKVMVIDMFGWLGLVWVLGISWVRFSFSDSFCSKVAAAAADSGRWTSNAFY